MLDIAAHHPATTRHLATKLCRRFITDHPATAKVDHVADAFTASGGDIRTTLRALFASESFADSAGCKLKRPFRYPVSALRITGARTDGSEKLQIFLLSMGHAPFQYPTPDGYTDEPAPWLGTLLWRWNFAVALAGDHSPARRSRFVVCPTHSAAAADRGASCVIAPSRPVAPSPPSRSAKPCPSACAAPPPPQ